MHLFPAPLSLAAAPQWVVRSAGATVVMFEDYQRDPAWQRDSILLLWYCGMEDVVRGAATGLKPKLGFDLEQLNVQFACAFIVAACWLGVAYATDVLGSERYSRWRVLATWALSAPPAAALRLGLFGGYFFNAPDMCLVDALATLALMLGLREAEEQGFV